MNRNDGAVGDARKRADESIARPEERDVAPETMRLRLRMAFLATDLDGLDAAMATALSHVAMAELGRTR